MNSAVPVPPLRLATFLDYAVKTSSRGDYYAFNILMQDGSRAYCITDAIHSKKIEFLLDELDQKRRPLGPVKLSRGSGTEYRIDLEAVNRGFWAKTQESKPEAKSERIRAQFEIEEHKLEALKRLAAAERYDSYTDWLRAVVDRALLNGGVR